MHRSFSILPFALSLAFALGACTGDDGSKTGSGDTRAIDSAQLAPPLAGSPADTAAMRDTVPSQPVATHTAVISTSAGDIEVELYGLDAPKTVANFVGLARKNFYNGILFHRVIPGFVIQGGDPLSKDPSKRDSWGSGGESIYSDEFEDELNADSPSGRRGYTEGTLAMANAGPNTNSSQFFIILSAAGGRQLTYNYTIFGAVRKGMEAVRGIEQTGTGGEKPANPASITKVTVTDLPAAAQMPKTNS